MNFRQIMALAPFNDERWILGNKSFEELRDIGALRKVEIDRLEKEMKKLREKNNELKRIIDSLITKNENPEKYDVD